MWLQCQHPSLFPQKTPPKPRNIGLFRSSACYVLLLGAFWSPLAQGSDLWNIDFTQIFGGLARLAGC